MRFDVPTNRQFGRDILAAGTLANSKRRSGRYAGNGRAPSLRLLAVDRRIPATLLLPRSDGVRRG